MTATNFFNQSMQSLLDSGDYSDLKITCNGHEWKVHKALVCSQSEFFRAAIRFPGREAADNVIDLPDDDPMAVGCMVKFMYHMTYRIPSESASMPLWIRPDWSLWACDADGKPRNMPVSSKREADRKCWLLSTKYLADAREGKDREFKVQPLVRGNDIHKAMMKDLCDLYPQWQEDPSNFPLPPNHEDAYMHARIYCLADKYDLGGLKKMAGQKFKLSLKDMFSGAEFYKAVSFIFENTPDDDILRTMVAEHIYKERKLYDMFRELDMPMKKIPGLAYHVLKYEWSMQHSLKKRSPMPSRPSLASSLA